MKTLLAGRRTTRISMSALGLFLLVAFAVPQAARAGFVLGSASDYAVLFEGGGNNTLQITNVTVNFNIGIGGTGKATDSGPSTVNGRIDFSAGNTLQFSNNNIANVISGGVHYNVSGVTTALNTVNSLNTTLGAESGTNVNIAGTTTINASAGVLDANGNRVFKVTGFNTTNSDVLTINGDGAGDSVVLNFIGLSANFNNQVKLNGISEDKVLYNFVGGSNLTGGPTLQINDNASSSPSNVVQGVFLDPNGTISVVNTHLVGRVYGGDSHDMQIVSGDVLDAPPVPAPSFLGLSSAAALALIGVHLLRNRRAGILGS
jgi:hypothetical protein